eukprot:TRINITY_DN1116_c0_g1_i1.p1 TRINITY_DN1116_c0_g1~~TRINITY_DN1116_c0_g1_i1.p1  ORF type:complete len:393 (+),score=62.80 TRINITY_DN1116_c0_g1_i1:48-1181(+)
MTDTNTTATDPCAFAGVAEYDTPLHVGAIFIIAVTSLLGTMLPIVAKKIPMLRIRELPFSCAKMFGSGIILATSLIHMLLPGIANLTNECLNPQIFGSGHEHKRQEDHGHSHDHDGHSEEEENPGYGAWAPALCIGAMLILHAIQFAVSKKIRSQGQKQQRVTSTTDLKEKEVDLPKTDDEAEKGTSKTEAEHSHSHSHSHHHDDGHAHAGELLFAQKEHEVSTYILELGIVSHSIIIGIALGVAVAPDFEPLLIAIVFHQFFEGIALSTVVLDTKFKGQLQSIIMVVFYTFTTPIGVAIGVGIASSYNSNSAGSLIAQGVLESISAGILLYDVLVNIISTHTRSPYFYSCSTRAQVLQLAFLWLGTFVMALIGKWA